MQILTIVCALKLFCKMPWFTPARKSNVYTMIAFAVKKFSTKSWENLSCALLCISTEKDSSLAIVYASENACFLFVLL